MSQRILLIHWAPKPDVLVAACGEELEVTYLDGKNKHYRHVYVTLSRDAVNCELCLTVLGIVELREVDP